jgi:hypothetical protein
MNLRDCEEILGRIYDLTSGGAMPGEVTAVHELAGVASAVLERQREAREFRGLPKPERPEPVAA